MEDYHPINGIIAMLLIQDETEVSIYEWDLSDHPPYIISDYICILPDELKAHAEAFLKFVWEYIYQAESQTEGNVLGAIREQSSLKEKIKALHKPLQVIPQSLHPVESVTH